MTATIRPLLAASGAVEVSARAEERAVTDRVRPRLRDDDMASITSLIRTGLLLEGEALVGLSEREQMYDSAFSCWQDVAGAPAFDVEELDGDLLPADVSLAFHLAATGTLAGRASEVRQVLSRALPASAAVSAPFGPTQPWARAVLHDTILAIVLLTRKDDGWSDIAAALDLLSSLRERQQQFEVEYLNSADDGHNAAVELVAYYHLAQMATLAGRYVENGEGASQGISVRLDTHLGQAQQAIEYLRDGRLSRISALLHALLHSLVRSSIWNQREGLGEGVAKLVANLASRANEHPTLELWPSQQKAMGENFLDPYRRAIIVEMPTSAGKTLLAKFAIVQTFALNRSATIAYVVPTRVLVNQITDELRRDLRDLGMTVEQAMPVFELDPTEDQLLTDPPSVLVTTPEKLDLLIRTNHSSLRNLSLVVVDEAHNLGDGARGARLELVLATIRRDRPGARYLLLSPFVPNAQELVDWLGDDRALTPIHVEWRPNKRVVAEVSTVRVGRINTVELRAIEATDNSNLPAGTRIALGEVERKPNSLKAISVVAAKMLAGRGPTLIVSGGKSYATSRALEVAMDRPEKQLSPFGEAVIRHTRAELGENNPMAVALRRGVAYHHAGVSLETRRFIEALMRAGEIDTICGTTTLAQGVNFPISNVLIESRRKGRDAELSYSDFWNIAGRAGRGLLSELGVIGYPVINDSQRAAWDRFFVGEAKQIASQLSDLVVQADRIGEDFTRGTLRGTPALSSFLQYLAHAMKVSRTLDAVNEIEDLLRSSLVFRQISGDSTEAAERLVRLCRAYLGQIRGESGLVSLADGTGFSTPTIRGLLSESQHVPGIRDRSTWEPGALFGDDLGPLVRRIELIGDLPEMSLSADDGGPFSPVRIAQILRDWVNGRPVNEMAEVYGDQSKTPLQRQAKFSGYLHGQLTGLASWGMGALESVALAGTTPTGQEEAEHVPSMIFFGVRDRESVWLRMAGLTREAATGASKLYREQSLKAPSSFGELRDWVSGLDENDWARALPESPLTGADMKLLWSELHS